MGKYSIYSTIEIEIDIITKSLNLISQYFLLYSDNKVHKTMTVCITKFLFGILSFSVVHCRAASSGKC